MTAARSMSSIACVVAVAGSLAALQPVDAGAQTRATTALTGAWTLNKDLSDQPMDRSERGGRDGERGRRGGGGFGGGRGGGRGGFGGGGMGRGGGDRGATNREDMARLRDAMRDITEPSDHLTITETESMIVITAGDGRTTRLSPDGKKIKDDNTKIERKTKRDGDKLVSEIGGLPFGKITQTFSVDPEHRQLRIALQMEGVGRSGQPHTVTYVYDADAK